MNVTGLEERAESVKAYFLNLILDLSNEETEVVVDYLLRYFEESSDRLKSTER